MTSNALFVDLPNFYSHLLSSKIGDPRSIRDYFLYWLDFDRLAEALAGDFSSVWVFYSGRRFGPRSNRIQDEYLDGYIERINSLTGVTAYDVNIPGKQREPVTYQCEKCGEQGVAEWESEKGIDASLTVHLFDTMDTWNVAYLLSGDADFVPAVTSLRRRGKIVIGAGFSEVSSALKRECFDYVDLCELFLREDFVAYEIFKRDGLVQKWLTEDIKSRSDDKSQPIELSFEWQFRQRNIVRGTINLFSASEISAELPYYNIYLMVRGPIDLSTRQQLIEKFQTEFPDYVREVDWSGGKIQLAIEPSAWGGVENRLESIPSYLKAAHIYEARVKGAGFTLKYEYNSSTNKYEVVEAESN